MIYLRNCVFNAYLYYYRDFSRTSVRVHLHKFTKKKKNYQPSLVRHDEVVYNMYIVRDVLDTHSLTIIIIILGILVYKNLEYISVPYIYRYIYSVL